MTTYFRPIPRSGDPRPSDAVPLAGGRLWFSDVIAMTRDGRCEQIAPSDVPADVLERLTAPRAMIAGIDMAKPALMGILNVTPDSFSDGGRFVDPKDALAQARQMAEAGADIIDIGGESTRPGAETVPVAEEVARVKTPISGVAAELDIPISIDTRKAAVAEAALDAGARIVNDVSGFTFDPALAQLCADRDVPVCVMHAQGDPQTMQDAPYYADVRFDVFDFLDQRVAFLEGLGIPRSRVIVDPGIGFGKTLEHNLTLLREMSLFHGLGCAILVGASRKRFIGTISGTGAADTRMPGSVAVALHAAAQGVQILRVHDVLETRQALSLWHAVEFGEK